MKKRCDYLMNLNSVALDLPECKNHADWIYRTPLGHQYLCHHHAVLDAMIAIKVVRGPEWAIKFLNEVSTMMKDKK